MVILPPGGIKLLLHYYRDGTLGCDKVVGWDGVADNNCNKKP